MKVGVCVLPWLCTQGAPKRKSDSPLKARKLKPKAKKRAAPAKQAAGGAARKGATTESSDDEARRVEVKPMRRKRKKVTLAPRSFRLG